MFLVVTGWVCEGGQNIGSGVVTCQTGAARLHEVFLDR